MEPQEAIPEYQNQIRFAELKKMINFADATRKTQIALMAELVDALVSNTNGVKPVPVRSRLRALVKISSYWQSVIWDFSFYHFVCILSAN